MRGIFGFIIVSGFFLLGGLFFHWLMKRGPLKPSYLLSPKKFLAWAKDSGSVRAEAAGQHQHASIHDVSVFCDQRAAGDAGKAFLTSGVYDQICLGYSVVQCLVSTAFLIRKWNHNCGRISGTDRIAGEEGIGTAARSDRQSIDQRVHFDLRRAVDVLYAAGRSMTKGLASVRGEACSRSSSGAIPLT